MATIAKITCQLHYSQTTQTTQKTLIAHKPPSSLRASSFTMATIAKITCLLVALMAIAAPAAEAAFQCSSVIPKLTPCLGYLTGGPGPSPDCCGGVRALNGMAQTPQDRQTACGCLKSAAGSVPGLNVGNTAGLPGMCGVNIPYTISLKTDCSKIH